MAKDGKGTVGDSVSAAFGSALGSVTDWAGKKIKQGAGWATRQAVDGVTSTFTGKASPESEDGTFEPGAVVGKFFNNAPWYVKLMPFLGLILGYNFSDKGIFDTGSGMIKGVVMAGLAAVALNLFLGNGVKNDQLAAAHNDAPVKPDATINLHSVPGGTRTPPPMLPELTPTNG